MDAIMHDNKRNIFEELKSYFKTKVMDVCQTLPDYEIIDFQYYKMISDRIVDQLNDYNYQQNKNHQIITLLCDIYSEVFYFMT